MARSDRTGNRKMRNRQEVMRVPEMGYYLVVTDTEATERCYFEGLQDSLPDGVKHIFYDLTNCVKYRVTLPGQSVKTNIFHVLCRINLGVLLKMRQLYFEVTFPVIILSKSK